MLNVLTMHHCHCGRPVITAIMGYNGFEMEVDTSPPPIWFVSVVGTNCSEQMFVSMPHHAWFACVGDNSCSERMLAPSAV
jgi:hypothetical protein